MAKVPTKFQLSAGGVVFRQTNEGGIEVALIATNAPDGSRRWGLPKGLVERGEPMQAAARRRFSAQRRITSTAPMHVIASTPSTCAGLQAVDYFLWALQRLYERQEDRYVELLWPAFRLVNDLDDTRQAKYGVYYSQKKPLTLAALEDLPGI